MTGEAPSRILSEELEELRKRIIANHLRAGQKASGRTMASLRIDVSDDGGVLWGRKPFDTLETGRKGGKVPKAFTKIIRQWMKDKGVKGSPIPYKTNRPHKYTPQERGDMTLSFFIARKIKRSGTRLYRQGGRDDIYSVEIPITVQRIGERLMSLVSHEVESIKINHKVEII